MASCCRPASRTVSSKWPGKVSCDPNGTAFKTLHDTLRTRIEKADHPRRSPIDLDLQGEVSRVLREDDAEANALVLAKLRGRS